MKRFEENISSEQQRNFAPYSIKGKRPQFGGLPVSKRGKFSTTPWTHPFVCLSDRFKRKPPKAAWERQALHEAGLGEKKILFTNVDCNAEDYREKLLEEFPKLKDGGGFELLRCSANSRVLEPISSVALQSPRATQERVGRSKVYIRPIQADLDMTANNTENVTSQVVSF